MSSTIICRALGNALAASAVFMLAIGCGGNADRATDAGSVSADANTAGPDAEGGGSDDGHRGAGDIAADAAAASAPDDAAPPDSGPPIADAFVADRGPDAPGILIHVANNCPFTLWIRGTGMGATLNPDNQRFATGEAHDYVAPDVWPAARVTAYAAMPPEGELDKVEMTLETKLDGGRPHKVINYNITYVDWLGLPVEMVAVGTGSDCARVGCYVPEAQVLTGCPSGLLADKRCLSAGNFCSAPQHQAAPLCHALDSNIAACVSNPQRYPGCASAGATTPEAYACSGSFGQNPKWCAALNRGRLDDPDNGDSSLYYRNAPFNFYAKWVHATCPGIYAFPYDDYGKSNESGFHSCVDGTQLNITFCPAG